MGFFKIYINQKWQEFSFYIDSIYGQFLKTIQKPLMESKLQNKVKTK
jgi:hypothetical protein